VECEIPQLARNAYFTGKLLVERDFTDEQRYLVGKGLRHQQRLHGCGTVCGLKVTAHGDPACRDRFVVVQPGTAVDSCGHEILVERPQLFDLRARFEALFRERHPSGTAPEGREHRVQVCLRYAELPTEEVPALFDERGDGSCRPNRLLETFAIDLRLDPPDEPRDLAPLALRWASTVTVAGAHRAAFDPAHERLYVLTAEEPARLFVASTRTGNILASHTHRGHTGADVAVSAGGGRVYVAVHEADSREGTRVLVFDADDVHTPINSLAVEGGGGPVRLAAAPDGRLLALSPRRDELLIWGEEINRPRRRPSHQTVAVGAHPVDLAVAPDGRHAYVANRDGGSLTVVRLADPDDPVEVPVPGVQPGAIAVAETAGEDRLVVLDRSAGTLGLYAWRPHGPGEPLVALGPPVPLHHQPRDVAISPGARWAFTLSGDADGRSHVQPVDLHAAQLGRAHAAGRPQRVGDGGHAVEIAADGLTLAVPFSTEEAPAGGGVAVVAVEEEPAEGLIERLVDGCGDCGCGDCVVLATIEGYRCGERIDDDRIDNLRDRRLLPSTGLVTEVVRRMLQSGWGSGARGPQGAVGPPGPGLSDDYAHLSAISWSHAGTDPGGEALRFAFDREVRAGDLRRQSGDGYPEAFALLRRADRDGGRSYVEVAGAVEVGRVDGHDLTSFRPIRGSDLGNAVEFRPGSGGITPGDWRVVIRGDLIRDARGLAADLDLLATGDRVEGGTFYSYFTVEEGAERP
jgi:hypothetical protein